MQKRAEKRAGLKFLLVSAEAHAAVKRAAQATGMKLQALASNVILHGCASAQTGATVPGDGGKGER